MAVSSRLGHFFIYEIKYLNAEVFGDILPQVFPHKDISVAMKEIFVLTVVVCRSVDSQISQARRVRIVVDGVPEILVAWELSRLAKLTADQHVDCHG